MYMSPTDTLITNTRNLHSKRTKSMNMQTMCQLPNTQYDL